MRIGRLRHRLTIQAQSRTPNGSGGFTMTWADGTTVWANVRPSGADEAVQGNEARPRATFEVDCRYRTDITTAKRLKWGTRILKVVGTENPDGKRRDMLVRCVEEVVS